jgi:hypothetical protein
VEARLQPIARADLYDDGETSLHKDFPAAVRTLVLNDPAVFDLLAEGFHGRTLLADDLHCE